MRSSMLEQEGKEASEGFTRWNFFKRQEREHSLRDALFLSRSSLYNLYVGQKFSDIIKRIVL